MGSEPFGERLRIMVMRTSCATASASVSAELDAVFVTVTIADPVRFYPRSGILPAVVEVRDQDGAWDAVGHTRTIVLGGGGSVRERIDVAEAPRCFAYELTEFRGVFGLLVESARSEWRFTGTGARTTIEWRYSFRARTGRGPVVAAIVRFAWAPYMIRVLSSLVAEVERTA
jgi:hypothetical protein